MPIIDLSKATIYDAGKHYQGVGASASYSRRVRTKDGEVGIEKRPPMISEKWVNAAGHVVAITKTNGPGNQPTNTPYWHGKRETLRNAKGIPYGKCPFHTEEGLMWMPAAMRATNDACDPLDFGPGRTHGEHAACAHIEQIIAERMGKTQRANELEEERRKSQAQREAELRQKREEMMIAQMTAAASPQADDDSVALLRKIASNPDIMAQLQKLVGTVEEADVFEENDEDDEG